MAASAVRWQFSDEQVLMPTAKGGKLNCFGLISRRNHLICKTTSQSIDSEFIVQQMETLSLKINKPTVVVLDNAQPHTAHKVKASFQVWQNRGLYIFYLPTYSPQLNIAETLWRKLKYEWLRPEDYQSEENLAYAVNRAFAAVGSLLSIQFSPFNLN